MITRRSLLGSAAPLVIVAAGGTLAACTAAQEAQFATDWSNFVDKVNAILAKGCGALPGFTATANSIEAVVGAFYPTASAAIAAGAAAISAVASSICSAIPAAPPATMAARLKARTKAGLQTFVGNVNVNGKVIPIQGYSVK